MKLNCQPTQEKISCGLVLDIEDQKHLLECSQCQAIYTDYQMLATLFDANKDEFLVPFDFSDRVMNSIVTENNQSDWFENIFSKVNSIFEYPLVQYSSMLTGFGIGIFSFIRFVAFIFIPA